MGWVVERIKEERGFAANLLGNASKYACISQRDYKSICESVLLLWYCHKRTRVGVGGDVFFSFRFWWVFLWNPHPGGR